MRGAALGDEGVGVEAEVSLAHFEGDGDLPWREATQRRHPQLDDEPPSRAQVSSSIAEALDLLLLSAQVGDAVSDEVDQRVLPRDAGGGHVADGDR